MNSPLTQPHENRRDPTQPIQPRRPLPLRIIAWVFILWVILGWLRFAGRLISADLVTALLPSGLPTYLLAAGLLWGVMGLPVLWGLLRRAHWAIPLTRITAIIYPASYWFERLFLWRDPNARDNGLFMLILTALWLMLVFGAMRMPRVLQYFNHPQERG